MKQNFNANQITMLMNENSLSNSSKNRIASKIDNIIELMNNPNDINNVSEFNSLLSSEQKATARTIVNKNDILSKKLIKSMSFQKENLLQTLEISQLRLEAELKTLNDNLNLPVLKTNASLWAKLLNLFKLPFLAKNKKAVKVNSTREKINSTTLKLTSLQKNKEDLTKELGDTGLESLKYLNKVTYTALLPGYYSNATTLENIKNKMAVFQN
jgi:hypothetical protein